MAAASDRGRSSDLAARVPGRRRVIERCGLVGQAQHATDGGLALLGDPTPGDAREAGCLGLLSGELGGELHERATQAYQSLRLRLPPPVPGRAPAPMTTRPVDALFYGLFMDLDLLRASGAVPRNPRRACVDDFALRIGQRATLIPSPGGCAYGMLIALTHAELERLYAAPGLEDYRPEAVVARPLDGGPVAALCYNLAEPPGPQERNADYAARLQRLLGALDFPAQYVAAVS